MNKALVIFGLLMIVGFVVFKYVIVPQIESQIQAEAARYLGPLSSVVTLENLNSACGLTSTQIPILGITVKSVVQAISPSIIEDCNQLATLMQILSLEPFVYFIGFVLVVIGFVLGGKKEVVREKAAKEEDTDEEEEPENEEPKEKEETPKKQKKEVKYCSECGSPNKTEDKFCGNCGKKLK